MADITTACVNGELRPGDLVLSTPHNGYACLVGTVLSIEKAGTPEHDPENETDDIHVNFMETEYSENRMREIEQMLGDLYGRPTLTPGVLPPIDDVIMAPDMLVNITGIASVELAAILDSAENAAAYYRRVAAPAVLKVEVAAPSAIIQSAITDKNKPLFDGAPSYAQIQRIFDRVAQNFSDFEKGMLQKGKEEIFRDAEQIAAMENARYYLTEYAHELAPDTIEGLLKLDDPVKVVAFAWRKHTEDLSDMTGLIRETAIKADIAKSERDPGNADKRVMRSFIPGDEKPSVLEQIRKAREESKNNPAPRKDGPGKDRGPEL